MEYSNIIAKFHVKLCKNCIKNVLYDRKLCLIFYAICLKTFNIHIAIFILFYFTEYNHVNYFLYVPDGQKNTNHIVVSWPSMPREDGHLSLICFFLVS